ncbi:MAG TPA: hypothetical protein VF158_06105 [Longimicrobiales bacterium]
MTTERGEESIEFPDNDVQIKAVEARMARHNRESRGTDQRGFDYVISYQPDWLQVVKVTRHLESGRQSTKTLFRNPGWREQPPGSRVRTRIASPEQDLDFEIVVHDPRGVVKRVVVETVETKEDGTEEPIVFTVEDFLPPPPPDDDSGNGDEEP